MHKHIKQWRKVCGIVVVNIVKCSEFELSGVIVVPQGQLSSVGDQLAHSTATVGTLPTVLCNWLY